VYSQTNVQRPPLGTQKRGLRSKVVVSHRLSLKLTIHPGWLGSLLTGGRCSEGVLNTGLTVLTNFLTDLHLFLFTETSTSRVR
jgi:hypothetical protein